MLLNRNTTMKMWSYERMFMFMFMLLLVTCQCEDNKTLVSVLDSEGKKLAQTVFKSYYPSGNINMEGSYINNKREGVWKHYYNDNQNFLESEGLCVNDVNEGVWLYYFNNPCSQVREQGSYVNGKRSGLWTLYHIAQSVTLQNTTFQNTTFRNTIPHYIISESGYYVNGLKEGVWVKFDINDRITDMYNYVILGDDYQYNNISTHITFPLKTYMGY